MAACWENLGPSSFEACHSAAPRRCRSGVWITRRFGVAHVRCPYWGAVKRQFGGACVYVRGKAAFSLPASNTRGRALRGAERTEQGRASVAEESLQSVLACTAMPRRAARCSELPSHPGRSASFPFALAGWKARAACSTRQTERDRGDADREGGFTQGADATGL